ncbi:MAG: NADP-dependent methylenetetrahydromethanopterin/methylenetetrahydrofolate dehydrogenase [Anaerolineaceae bacterium]|nr:NADP-dependent methylenetetrahydromethanopterin/methylenetetrahydrofolate dehydrogenase [Anaerolineaceae bacterium]
MKKLLLQLDSDPHASSFDTVTAYDAGADHVFCYGGVGLSDVRNLVYGAMFTRGGADLKNTAIFIGGSSVPAGEAMLKEVRNTFFGPVRVSVMADPNGSNTTAAAEVLKIIRAVDVSGKNAVIFAGTGPVGVRAAALLSKEGCHVTITSRQLDNANKACSSIKERFNLDVTPMEVRDDLGVTRALENAQIVLATGAAGIELVKKELWSANPKIEVVADANAVPPIGIGGIQPTDDGKERDGKLAFGAIGIGGLKMKIHHASVAKLFEKNDLVLDIEEIYEIGKAL